MPTTRPTADQLRFNSSANGESVLDDYMEAAERGGRSLADLLSELFDPSGTFVQFVDFREDPLNAGDLQYRFGTFVDPEAGWQTFTNTDFTTFVTNAANSETNAAASAAAASTSETNAATSASNASTSETNAATSETNANNAQSYAEEWANNPQNTLVSAAAGGNQLDEYSAKHWAAIAAAEADWIDDHYLGSKASNPALDNDGDPLVDGAFYWNNVTKTLVFYDLGTTTWTSFTSGGIPDATQDSVYYVRQNGDWATFATAAGATLLPDLTVSTLNGGDLILQDSNAAVDNKNWVVRNNSGTQFQILAGSDDLLSLGEALRIERTGTSITNIDFTVTNLFRVNGNELITTAGGSVTDLLVTNGLEVSAANSSPNTDARGWLDWATGELKLTGRGQGLGNQGSISFHTQEFTGANDREVFNISTAGTTSVYNGTALSDVIHSGGANQQTIAYTGAGFVNLALTGGAFTITSKNTAGDKNLIDLEHAITANRFGMYYQTTNNEWRFGAGGIADANTWMLFPAAGGVSPQINSGADTFHDIVHTGGGQSISNTIRVSAATTPRLLLEDSDVVPVDEKVVAIWNQNGDLSIGTADDSGGAANTWMSFVRGTGTAASTININRTTNFIGASASFNTNIFIDSDRTIYHDGRSGFDQIMTRYRDSTGSTELWYTRLDDTPVGGEVHLNFESSGSNTNGQLQYNGNEVLSSLAGQTISGSSTTNLTLLNLTNASQTGVNKQAGLQFQFGNSTDSTIYNGPYVVAITESTWSDVASSRDASLHFGTILDGSASSAMVLNGDKTALFNNNVTIGGAGVSADEGGQINLTVPPNGTAQIDRFIDAFQDIVRIGTFADVGADMTLYQFQTIAGGATVDVLHTGGAQTKSGHLSIPVAQQYFRTSDATFTWETTNHIGVRMGIKAGTSAGTIDFARYTGVSSNYVNFSIQQKTGDASYDLTFYGDAPTTGYAVPTTEILRLKAADQSAHFGGDAVFTSGNGVDFSATANATGTNVSITSEIFTDYEEGTWQPQVSDGTTEVPSYTFRSGRYTKIGRVVTVQGDFQVSSITGLTGSNSLRIGNLPFTNGGLNSAGTVSYATGLAITANTNVSCYVAGSQSYLSATVWDVSTGISPLTVTQLSADGRLMFSATYTVD